MPKKSGKKRQTAPMSAAGLITYFEEEAGGVKLRPEAVIAIGLGLVVVVLMAHLGFFGF